MTNPADDSLPLWLYARATPYEPDAATNELELITNALRHQGMHAVGRSSDISVWPWPEDAEAWRGWTAGVAAVHAGRAAGICVWHLRTLGSDMLARFESVLAAGGEVWTAYPLMRVTRQELQRIAAS